jgi:hypothetical protein
MQLTWLRALDQAKVDTMGDLVFVASVGEEGKATCAGSRRFSKTTPRSMVWW